jgi:hypothetical protein
MGLVVVGVKGEIWGSQRRFVQLLLGEMLLEGDKLDRDVEVSTLINKGVVLGRRFQRGHGKRSRQWYEG